jgi:RHS repeat-associated protein
MNRSPTAAYDDTRGFDWSGTCFFSFDERGNTTMVTDGYGMEGSILSLRQYDSFGNSEQGLAEQRPHYLDFNPFDGFGGQWGYQTDRETGLVLCGQRYYDPSAGRWISRDPIGYDGGVNIYAYCRNRPTGQIDPHGTAGIINIGWGRIELHRYLWLGHGCHGFISVGYYPNGGDDNTDPNKHNIVIAPDPKAGQGHGIQCDHRPAFEKALCQCVIDHAPGITNNGSVPLPGHENDGPAGGGFYGIGTYVCGNWAGEMWDCAKKKAPGPNDSCVGWKL